VVEAYDDGHHDRRSLDRSGYAPLRRSCPRGGVSDLHVHKVGSLIKSPERKAVRWGSGIYFSGLWKAQPTKAGCARRVHAASSERMDEPSID
jgi:hypothetical protein